MVWAGAQPLAATMAGACCTSIEIDPTGFSDGLRPATSMRLHPILTLRSLELTKPKGKAEAVSVALQGGATSAELFAEIAQRGYILDLWLLDQDIGSRSRGESVVSR